MKTCPEIFKAVKIENFQLKSFNIHVIAQNIDCGYTISEAALMCMCNLCFRFKIRKVGIPIYTLVPLIKVGCKGVYIPLTCFTDVL